MKKLSIILCSLLIPLSHALAQFDTSQVYFIVEGTVFEGSSAHPVANHPVKLHTDSIDYNGWTYYNEVFTDEDGYYVDTIGYPANIGFELFVETPGCDGVSRHAFFGVTPNSPNVVWQDFDVCNGPPPPPGDSCFVDFEFHPLPDNPMGIWLKAHVPPHIAEEAILWKISRPDGTGLEDLAGRELEYNFEEQGEYEICLEIESEADCFQKFCNIIYVPFGEPGCETDFFIERVSELTVQLFLEDDGTDNFDEIFWDFGDGNFSSDRNPVHTYADYGVYEISLATVDFNGCQAVEHETILLAGENADGCVAKFEAIPNADNPFSFDFVSYSTGNFTAQKWFFPDGIIEFGERSNFVFPHEGIFKVGLLVWEDTWSCFDTTVQDIVVGNPSPCRAEFGFYPDDNDPFKVHFDAFGSPGQVEYYWTFGDGSESGGKFLDHSYDEPGEYEVCLTVSTPNGCEQSFCQIIYVPFGGHPCEAHFYADEQGQKTFTFNPHIDADENGNDRNYEWDFGDGNSSTEAFPTHTYRAQGIYEVCLFVSDSTGCEARHCERVYVIETPAGDCEASFEYYQDSTLGSQFAFQFINKSTGSFQKWEWHFGDGNVSTAVDPVHIYPGDGIYRAGILIYDSTFSCWDSITEEIFVGDGEFDCHNGFDFLPDPNDPFVVQFKGYGHPWAHEWKWDFGDGVNHQGREVRHRFEEPGTYQVCVRSFDERGCEAIFCQEIRVPFEPPCFASFDWQIEQYRTVRFYNNSHGSNPDKPLTVAWDFGDGNTSNLRDPLHTYERDGVYQVCITVSDGEFCETVFCNEVFILVDPSNDCQAKFEFDVQDDDPFTYKFTNYSTGNYTNLEWHFGDGTTSRRENPIHTYPGEGVYHGGLLAFDSTFACWDTAEFRIVIGDNEEPECFNYFNFEPDRYDGFSVRFLGFAEGRIRDWKWDFGDGHHAYGKVAGHRFQERGIYEVCLTTVDERGCIAEYCEAIQVPFAEECFAEFDFEVKEDRFYKFINNSRGGSEDVPLTYFWDFGDGNTSTEAFPVHRFERDGIYEICLTVSAGDDCSESICRTTFILNEPAGDCVADFKFENDPSQNDPFAYKFTNESTGSYTEIEWYFGEEPLTEENPTYRFDEEGFHFIGLLIRNDDWTCWDTAATIIRIGEPEPPTDCRVDLEVRPLDDDPFAFGFAGIGGSDIINWEWSFGDGNFDQGKFTRYTYNRPGVYRVCLRATFVNGCVAEKCFPIIAPFREEGCEAKFRPEITDVGKVKFHNKSSTSDTSNPPLYFWSFGDGNTATGFEPDYTYGVNGTYLVSLFMYDNSGCADTTFRAVTIDNIPPPAECDVHFYYFAKEVNPDGTLIQFEGEAKTSGNRQDLMWSWDFGDGTTSSAINPVHRYTEAGVYNACLTITDQKTGCTATYCEAVVIDKEEFYYTLCGSVYVGDRPADDVTVYLITLDIENQTLIALDSTVVTTSGSTADTAFYCFEYVPSNFYFTKAALNEGSAYYQDYVPTYFGDALYWAQGNFVPLFTDRYNIDINMIETENPGGPGFVGGNVFQGANKLGNSAESVQVMLIDSLGQAVAYTYSDENGEFLFTNVPEGNFSVYAEVLNASTLTVTVSVTEENPNVDNVGVEVGEVQVVGFLFEDSDYFQGISKVYPNPAKQAAYLDVNLKASTSLRFELRNIQGQLLWTEEMQLPQGEHQQALPIRELPEGVYMINIVADGKERIMRRMIKR